MSQEKTAQRIGSMADLDTAAVCYWKDESGLWWIYLPGCGAGVLSKHSVEEHKDGTVTVSPSIVMHGHREGTPTECHGYLTKGIWRPC